MKISRLSALVALTSVWAWGESVRLLVHDYAGTPTEKLEQASAVVTGILREAGIPVEIEFCIDGGCPPAGPDPTFHVRLRQKLSFRRGALGVAWVGHERGGYIDAWVDEARAFEQAHAPGNRALGHVLAHELGHMLLGSVNHSPTGIMKARWNYDDSRLMAQGRLRFTSAESARMRERLRITPRV